MRQRTTSSKSSSTVLDVHDDHSILRLAAVWTATLIGSITLSQIALGLASIYTALQIWKWIRDYRKERRLEKFEAWLKREPKE